jgi:glycosyltransferase involved in cell wall biosynthesis
MSADGFRTGALVRPLHNLHVRHSLDDGAGRWVDDFARSDPFSHNFILESVGELGSPNIGYRLLDGMSGRVIQSLSLRSPIVDTELSHPEYRGMVEALCRTFDFTHLYVSSLIGHTLDLLELGIAVTVVHHDHHPWCPAVHLFHQVPCTRCQEGELEACRRGNPVARPAKPYAFYRELRDRYLQACSGDHVTHVAPSHGLVDALRTIDPRFEAIPFVVIEHGIEAAENCFGGATDGRRLRVVVLGRLELRTGSGLLSQSFEALRMLADLYLVGSGDFGRYLRSRWGVTVISRCQAEELTGVLQDISPDVGLLLSVVPESTSYALAELHVRGIPPVATRHGAFRERISHGVDGFLFPPDASSLVTLLASLDARREELRAAASRLQRPNPQTVREMVYRYYCLRRDLPHHLERNLEVNRHLELRA